MDATLPIPASSTTQTAPASSRLPAFLLLSLLLLLLAADRARLLYSFGFQFVDQDQAVYWLMASDASHLQFHEPCFYGQSYNVPIEAWLAAPLLAMHIPPYIALPLIATFSGLTPFLLFAALTFKRRPLLAAALVAIPLLLPIQYAMLSGILCGFANGLLPASFAVALLLFSKKPLLHLLAGFLSALALIINASSSLLLIPLILWFALAQGKNLRPILLLAIGALLAAPLALAILWFYHTQPDRIVWYHEPLSFHLDYLLSLLKNPDLLFAYFIPLPFSGGGAGFLFYPLLAALLLLFALRRQWPLLAAGLLFTFILLASMGTNRVFQSAAGLYLSFSRLYLAIPLAFAIALILLDRSPLSPAPAQFFSRHQKTLLTTLTTLALALFTYRHLTFNQVIAHTVQWPGPLRVLPVPQLRDEVQTLSRLTQQTHTRLLLVPNADCVRAYAYAALSGDRFDTLLLQSDRRFWRRQEESTRHDDFVLLLLDPLDPLTLPQKAALNFPPITRLLDSPPILQLTPHNQSPLQIAQTLAQSLN